jgi:serine protease Do
VIDSMPLDFAGLAETLRRVTVELVDDGAARGSGVLWPRGHVVTNAHVVRRPRLVGVELPTATLAQSAARIGSLVVAVGHPFGLRGALTAGVVHAIGPIARNGVPWIHADVRLAPGNSGGPLADVSGAVVGINAMVAGGLALAVPVSRVLDFVRSAGVAPS